MDNGFPEDWQHPLLQQLDAALRCQICKEPYTGPVALPCQHAFCSECIRSNFDVRLRAGHKTLCPLCNAATDPGDLRPVFPLRQAAGVFAQARQVLLQLEQQSLKSQQGQQTDACIQSGAAPVVTQARLRMRSSSPQVQRHQQHHHHQQQQPQSTCVRPRRLAAAAQPQAAPSKLRQAAATSEDIICIVEDSAEQPGSGVTAGSSSSDPDWDATGPVAGDAAGPAAQELRSRSAADGSDDSEFVAGGQRKRTSLTHPTGGASKRRHSSGGNAASSAAVQQSGLTQRVAVAAVPLQSLPQPLQGQHQPPHQQQQHMAPAVRAPLPKGMVECPVCGICVRQALADRHVEHCLMRASGPAPAAKQPAAAAAAATRSSTAQQPAPAPAAAAAGSGLARVAASGGSGGLGRAAGGVYCVSTRPGRPAAAAAAAGKPLEPPPKLCFHMMHVRELRKKLKELGLNIMGEKEELVARYTAYRSFLLSAKDAGTVYSRQQAVREFTRRNVHGSDAAAAEAVGDGGSSMWAAAGAQGGSGGGRAAGPSELQQVPGVSAYSHADLIKEARRRMKQQRRQRKQQQAGEGEDEGGEEEQQQQQPEQQQQHLSSPVAQQDLQQQQQQQQQWDLHAPHEEQQEDEQQQQQPDDASGWGPFGEGNSQQSGELRPDHPAATDWEAGYGEQLAGQGWQQAQLPAHEGHEPAAAVQEGPQQHPKQQPQQPWAEPAGGSAGGVSGAGCWQQAGWAPEDSCLKLSQGGAGREGVLPLQEQLNCQV